MSIIAKLSKFDQLKTALNDLGVTGKDDYLSLIVFFSGPNGGSKVNSGNSDYSGWLSYAGCYVTSDMVIDSREFNDAISLEYTSDDLFIDPTNGDFRFKPELKFDGEGVAGDPRWWAN